MTGRSLLLMPPGTEAALADLSSLRPRLCFGLSCRLSACLQVEDQSRPGRQWAVMEQAVLQLGDWHSCQ